MPTSKGLERSYDKCYVSIGTNEVLALFQDIPSTTWSMTSADNEWQKLELPMDSSNPEERLQQKNEKKKHV